MAKNSALYKAQNILSEHDKTFFDDMHRMFIDMGRGEVSKYMYDNPNAPEDNNVWEDIVRSKTDYYVPQADCELLQKARLVLAEHMPSGTPYVDFGVGCDESFKRYALPNMKKLNSSEYYGVDFDQKILDKISVLNSQFDGININPIHMDFFVPTHRIISSTPALGVMNGITLTNMYGSLNDKNLEANLVGSLKYLSQLTNYGWLLLSIDTNQDRDTLMKMYLTELNSRLNIASIPRMKAQLPVTGFDSSLFFYDPVWLPEKQLLAHLATATENQDFLLGEYRIQVQKGQKFHMFNSYKFRQEFFEGCCPKANMDIIKSWKHDSGVMLYLLKDVSHRKS